MNRFSEYPDEKILYFWRAVERVQKVMLLMNKTILEEPYVLLLREEILTRGLIVQEPKVDQE